MPRYILGIDPGKKSGLSMFDLFLENAWGDELQFNDASRWLEEHMRTFKPAVVAEAFVINANTVKNTQAPWSLEMIGVARFLSMKYGCTFAIQPQSSAKRFATNERLQRLGWYVPGKGHMMDSHRQVLLHMVNNGWWHSALDEPGTE